MKCEILTCPVSKQQLWEELEFVVAYFIDNGYLTCEVLFGFAWGMDYYPTKDWNSECISLGELKAKILSVENSGLGLLSNDDLFLDFPHLQFRFCNDSDIHIYFNEYSEDIEYFYSRWGAQGFNPAEYLKNQVKGPGEKVRSWINA
jgi:hypothetical protein